MVVLLSLVVPFVGTAIANHGNCRLNLEPETGSNPINASHTITATLSTTGTATATTGEAGAQCTPEGNPVEIDFEIIGTATVTQGAPPAGTGVGDAADTPDSPDATCNVTVTGDANPQNDTCTIVITSGSPGQVTVRGWIDHDKNNTTNEADMTEGQNEVTTPGAATEPDITDVVTKEFFGDIAADVTLDCDDDDNVDIENNQPGQPEVYTCQAFGDVNNNNIFDNVGANPETGVQGIRIDAENLAGANDPDNSAAAGTADFNDACTTDANGRCQFTLTPTENEVGTADVCFWLDPDADNNFNPAGAHDANTAANDGEACDEEQAAGAGDAGDAFANDRARRRTDVVRKNWALPVATRLDAEPENDSNQVGTQHTVTATVFDQFGNPMPGVAVDFDIEGRNDGLAAAVPPAEPESEGDQILTNAQGVATFTYTDRGTAIGSGFQTDTITVCADPGNADNCVAEGPGLENADLIDTVQKFWFTTVPATGTVVVDMDLPCGEDDPTTDPNPVDTLHTFCVIARDANNQPIPGKAVTVTLTGPGNIVRDPGTPADTADDVVVGKTTTVNTDQNGQVQVTIYSTQSGTTTVTATSENRSDTGTKQWSAEAAARAIDCTPETATNLPGTSHTVSCLVTDRFGNPIPGSQVFFTESGPGRIDRPTNTPANATTDANGIVEVVLTTSSGETGTQTLTARLAADAVPATGAEETGGNLNTDDECEQAAGQTLAVGSEAARPTTAGVCADDVTKTWSTTITPPTGFARTIGLETSKAIKTFGREFTLTATLRAADPATPANCIAGVTVQLSRTVAGTTDSVQLETAVTDAQGVASFNRTADKSASYTVSVAEGSPEGCGAASSTATVVQVRKRVELSFDPNGPIRRGTRVRITVKVFPCAGHRGDKVTLWKAVDGVLAKIATKDTNNDCRASFRRRVRRDSVYQGRSPKSDADHLGGKSRRKAINVRGS